MHLRLTPGGVAGRLTLSEAEYHKYLSRPQWGGTAMVGRYVSAISSELAISEFRQINQGTSKAVADIERS